MRRPPPWLLDVAVAVVVAVCCQVELRVRFEDGPFLGPLWWNTVLTVAAAVPLAFRRSHPRAAFAALCAVYLLPRLVAPHASLFFGGYLPFLLVIYTVARRTDRHWARWAWAGGVVYWLGMVARSGTRLHLVVDPVLPVGLGVLVWLLGRMLARMDQQKDDLADALDRLATAQAEREREMAGLERARVAADMHDVVGHAVSLMVVQIGHARLRLEADGSVRTRLREAEATGRRALLELRRALGVLHTDSLIAPAPVAGLAGLAEAPPAPTPTPRQLRWDAVVALGFAALAAYEPATGLIDDGFHAGPRWLNVALGVVLCLPLAWRRRAPLATYAVMVAVLCAPTLMVGHSLYLYGTLLPLCLAAYTLARSDDGWPARTTWSGGLLLALVAGARTPGAHGASNLVFSLIFTTAAWAAGRAMRRLDRRGARLRATLEALAVERTAREEAAVEQERRRIAAEMHDVVAHAVSAMIAQVGAARLEEPDPQRRDGLRAAETSGRQALDELRQTLGLLRGSADADLRPLPDLDALPSLLAAVRVSGLRVVDEVDVVGALPEGVGLTTYRIVQEALTNVIKHGGAGDTVVAVSADALEVRVRVDSPLGAGLSLPAGGHGLAGMRQRVALYDGRLEAGAVGDRFVVDVVLRLQPLDAAALA